MNLHEKVKCLAEEYLEDHPAGGQLHIVLADGGVSDHVIRHCIIQAKSANDIAALRIAKMLMRMPSQERLRLYRELGGRPPEWP